MESCWQLINMGSGWSAPIQVTLCPIDSCYSLNRGIRYLERSFHLSSTQGELSTPRENYHLASHYTGGLSLPERIITSPLVDFGLLHQYVEKSDLLSIFWSTSSLTSFPHNNSGLVTCFYLRGYGLRALICNKRLHFNFLICSVFQQCFHTNPSILYPDSTCFICSKTLHFNFLICSKTLHFNLL